MVNNTFLNVLISLQKIKYYYLVIKGINVQNFIIIFVMIITFTIDSYFKFIN